MLSLAFATKEEFRLIFFCLLVSSVSSLLALEGLADKGSERTGAKLVSV